MTNNNSNWVFGRAIATDNQNLYILTFTSSEEGEPLPVTQVVWVSGDGINNFMIPWEVKDLGFSNLPEPHFVFVGPRGEVTVFSKSGNINEFINDSDKHPLDLGVIREIKKIGFHFYVVGMGRQVYRRDSVGGILENANWVRMDFGVAVPSPNAEILGFNSIDGFSENDIYAVGWQGEIWHFDGEIWAKINSPTNVKLEKVICAGDGYVYAAGQLGILLKGDAEKWDIIDHGATTNQFWGAAWYRSRLWLSTSNALYLLKEDNLLEEVNFNLGENVSCSHLANTTEALWSIGSNHLLKTNDGVSWSQILLENP